MKNCELYISHAEKEVCSISRKIGNFFAWKLLLCFFSLVGGCAILTPQATIVTTIVTQPEPDRANTVLANFNLLGRISVRDEKQHFSGRVRWEHTGFNDEILLLSPLGQTVAQIERDLEGVRLTTSEQAIFYAVDVESLTEEILGWRLPLKGLQYWVQGMHSPATASEQDLDVNGRIKTIRQDNWQINYIRYFSVSAVSLDRPRIIELSYNDDLKIKLVVDDWKVE
ncbi:outer membrane lipoprotein LolB [Nitrosomonas cryotolerans]|uniref:Outer-membrane lipoprotein LolB n=1 Tax=Nitrosomonas cryotolerans ATCC 49181 TaxID=1131553 RepID=A0A1N6FA03_9PROT|nr:lipoprotein insertase outer membrane protein LolB [Nitrosomonas cryotolerans]SFP74774.1 outer membrane lipoprotein LolB [Nitrosomonas cryotolerans]SIN92111.1 outer membrane lipoprotein LolB [Nitrosomonas cryotolerans ATCC 49181]